MIFEEKTLFLVINLKLENLSLDHRQKSGNLLHTYLAKDILYLFFSVKGEVCKIKPFFLHIN